MNEKKHPDEDTSSLSRHGVGNDNEPVSPLSLKADILMGVRFFSVLPTGNSPHEAPRMGRMVPALSLTSIVIALFPALILGIGFWLGLPPLLAACFGVAAQIFVTGAMAEDALADSMDGLFGGHSPQRRLTIMKDSTHGTYGVVAIVLLIGIRIVALGALLVQSLPAAIILWIGAQTVARQSALWLLVVLPPAREDGTARATGTLSHKAFFAGALICALLAFIFTGMLVSVLGLLVAGGMVVALIWLWTGFCRSKVGGYSGDLIGAGQSLVEIMLLSTFILFI